MYSNTDLDDAVAAGVISADHAAALRAYFDRSHASPAVDEEQFRLVSSFNDIFVSIASILVLVATGWLGGRSGHPALASALVAGIAWGLAEYFTRIRKMALPSILLLIAFVWGVFLTALFLFFDGQMPKIMSDTMLVQARIALAAAITAGAAWLHWRRFMVPLTVAAGVSALVGMALALILAIVPNAQHMLLGLLFTAGVGVFLFAMRWDMSDRLRQTRRSDVAFWLHLLAAPMIVHPVFSQLGLVGSGDPGPVPALIGLLVYVTLAIIALLTDRRAIMVSALVYVLAAISVLFERAGSISNSFAFTALVIGSALLMLSALWHRLRGWLMQFLPDRWHRFLPVAH